MLRAVAAAVIAWLATAARGVQFAGAAAGNRQYPPPRRADALGRAVAGASGWRCLVTLALIDGNLRRELTGAWPEAAPNFFFVDIQGPRCESFAQP